MVRWLKQGCSFRTSQSLRLLLFRSRVSRLRRWCRTKERVLQSVGQALQQVSLRQLVQMSRVVSCFIFSFCVLQMQRSIQMKVGMVCIWVKFFVWVRGRFFRQDRRLVNRCFYRVLRFFRRAAFGIRCRRSFCLVLDSSSYRKRLVK